MLFYTITMSGLGFVEDGVKDRNDTVQSTCWCKVYNKRGN